MTAFGARVAAASLAWIALGALLSPADARAERALVAYSAPPGEAQRAALRSHNARLLRLWDRHAWAALVDLPSDAQAAALMRDDPTVRAVCPDRGGAGASPSALRRTGAWDLGAPAAGRVALQGHGQTVALLDTGVDAGHPDLRGRVVRWLDLIDPAQTAPHDPHGHGTAVAGLIAGAGAAWRDGRVALTLTAPPGLWSAPERAPSLPVWPQDAPAPPAQLATYPASAAQPAAATLRDGPSRTLQARCASACVFPALAPSPQPRRVALNLQLAAPAALQALLPFRPAPSPPDDPRSPFAGAAPQARLVALRVLDASNRLPSTATLLDALVWLGDHGERLGVGVINLALALDRDGPNAAVDDALDRVAAALGASVVVAAPNDRPLASPATASSALVVTALGLDARLAPYAAPHARLGPGLIAAPGGTARAPLALTDSDHAPCKPLLSAAPCPHAADPFPGDATLGFGTSFAAAQASGVLALMREAAPQQPGAADAPSAAALRALLRATAAPGPTPDAPRLLNARSALDALQTTWRAAQPRVSGALGPALHARTWARRLSAPPPNAPSASLRVAYSAGLTGHAHLYAAAPDASGGLQRVASHAGDGLLRLPGGGAASAYVLVVERRSGAGAFTVERVASAPSPPDAPTDAAPPAPPAPDARPCGGCAALPLGAPSERRRGLALALGWVVAACWRRRAR